MGQVGDGSGMGNIISFDLTIPNKSISICAEVKNLSYMEKGIIKSGSEIIGIKETEQEDFDNYIESIKK